MAFDILWRRTELFTASPSQNRNEAALNQPYAVTAALRPRCLEAALIASTSSEVDCIEGGKNQSGIFILTLIYHVHICNVLVVRGGTLLHGKTL